MNKIFKYSTGLVGIYHVLLGGAALLLSAESTSSLFAFALGINVGVTPEVVFIAKFVGVYMLAFGIMSLLLSSNPVKYQALVWPVIALFGIRFLNRIFFFGAISEVFGMSTTRNIIGTLLIFAFFVIIYASKPKQA